MDAFSLLKYWKASARGGGGGGAAACFLPETAASDLRSSASTTATTTIVTSVPDTDAEDDAADDEGPFFDLEFAVPVEDEEEEGEGEGEVSENEEDEEEASGGDGDGGGIGDSDGAEGGGEFNITLSPSSGGDDRADPDLTLSPSDDLFFKGRLVAIEPPSSAGAEENSSAKAPAAQFSASFLKSATKFRVFLLGLKKSKLNQAKSEKHEADSGSSEGDKQQPLPSRPRQQKNTFTVKFKIEEVPIISLFTSNNSSRNSSSSSSSSSSSKKQNGDESAVSDENRFVMMQKYLKKVKPLYVRVSRRYGEKLRFSGQLTLDSAPSSDLEKSETEKTDALAKSQKQGNLSINIPAGLKVVRKHLGKSRSASSVTSPSHASKATATATAVAPETSKRRDDSLLQQQDGIQSAILHCKRSFNSCGGDGEASFLPRWVSDSSSYDQSIEGDNNNNNNNNNGK